MTHIFQFLFSTSGTNEVDIKLNGVMNQFKHEVIDPTTFEQFKIFFKYLAFVACAAKAPVRQKMLDETLAMITKAGTAENIERWCWWSPDQLSLLEQAENLPRVILIGTDLVSSIDNKDIGSRSLNMTFKI